MDLRQLVDYLEKDEKNVAECFIKLIYNSSANTAYQFMFTEAILRTAEEFQGRNKLDLDRVFLHYAEVSYDWCGIKRLFLGGTTNGKKGVSKINNVVDEFITINDINIEENISLEKLVELKKKICPLSRWVQENVGAESKGICNITSQYLIITDEVKHFMYKYMKDIRESNEVMAKKFLSKIEENNIEQINNLQLFERRYIEFEDVNKSSKRNSVLINRENKIDMLAIHQYIYTKGLNYSLSTLSNFYLSLRSKPFTILAGISGTGKSKLVRLFAEAIGADFTLIPVKPDWADATDLLGYRDLNQNYHMGKLIEVIERAQNDLDKPYIICLDEMNLARIEYYFSDFLSLIESRRWNGERIITDHFSGQDVEHYSIPENVYIVGTVNMDETTFQFSKKVLDRANTIELSEVNLAYDFEAEDEEVEEAISLHNEALRSQYLLLRECKAYKELATRVIGELIKINEILMPCGLEFAYRVRDEIVFYMVYNEEYKLLSEEEAFDFEILQKILPRINGTSRQIEVLLMQLIDLWTGSRIKLSDLEEGLDEAQIIAEATYPKSVKKVLCMLRPAIKSK